MILKDRWVDHCLRLSRTDADFYSGCRKILRGQQLGFEHVDETLQLRDAGYTSSKMRYLERAYVHEESIAAAVKLWNRRREQGRYGSVGFTCYNHFIKVDPNKISKRASVMGPCIQSVVLTWIDKKSVAIDVFYRTTEILKKFPADLVFLRDVLLAPFNFDGMKIVEIVCHFANITVHPMYFVTIIPHLENPIAELERIGRHDKFFRDWIVKWTARYTCPEFHRGIAKFSQALRVQADAQTRIRPKTMTLLNDYLRSTHPGYRNDYSEDEGDEE